MQRTAIAILSVLLALTGLRAQDLPNLSGTWTRESGAGGKTLTVLQTATELRIEGASGLFEGLPPLEAYKLDGSKSIYVQDFGDWWRKSETQLRWDGVTLTLWFRATGGWWKNLRPESELFERPHAPNTTRVVTFRGTEMTVESTVVDGNGDPPYGRGTLKATEIFGRSGL